MFKKILLTVLFLTIAAACCSGCNKSEKSDAADEPKKTEPIPVSDKPISLNELPTKNMVKRSRLYDGDCSRLLEKLQAAAEGSVTRIAFLGDSITQGSSASWENQYTNRFAAWWRENISENAEFINAGIGATDSYLAVHRVDTDVLSFDPDIIFIEFINDSDDEFYKSAMESLVRKCLAHPANPAVILIEMTQENGTCPQNVHAEVARHYDLPVISYHDAVMPEVNAKTLSWQDISPDNIHPNDAGHRMLSEFLCRYIADVKSSEDTAAEVKPFDASIKPITGDKYAKAALIGKETAGVSVTANENFDGKTLNDRFPDGWGCEDGGTLTFELEFKNLGILFEKMTDGSGGTAFISVDGELVCEAEADFSGGWGDYAANQEIVSFEERGKHTVTVKVMKGKRFELLRWMVS